MSIVYKIMGEIIELSAEVSEKTKTDVFVNLAGHVNAFEVRFYENGSESGEDFVYLFNGYYDSKDKMKLCYDLTQVKYKLKEFLKDVDEKLNESNSEETKNNIVVADYGNITTKTIIDTEFKRFKTIKSKKVQIKE